MSRSINWTYNCIIMSVTKINYEVWGDGRCRERDVLWQLVGPYDRWKLKWHQEGQLFMDYWRIIFPMRQSLKPSHLLLPVYISPDLSMMTSSKKTFSALLALCARNSPGHWWIPPTKASDAELWFFFHLRLKSQFNKQSIYQLFYTPSRPLWRHCNPISK